MPKNPTNLVFIPGLLCTHELFAPQLEALDGTVTMTVADHTNHDNIPALASGILAKAPQRFALAGLSLGGYLALEILRQEPERVSHLALLNTNARADRPEQSATRHKTIALAQKKGMDALEQFFTPLFIHPRRLDDTKLTGTISRMRNDTGFDTFKRQQLAIMGRRDNLSFLSEIQCPTLIIVGAQDQLTPPKVAVEMADAIAGSDLHIIADCGHLSTLEQPEIVSGLLRDWLQQAS